MHLWHYVPWQRRILPQLRATDEQTLHCGCICGVPPPRNRSRCYFGMWFVVLAPVFVPPAMLVLRAVASRPSADLSRSGLHASSDSLFRETSAAVRRCFVNCCAALQRRNRRKALTRHMPRVRDRRLGKMDRAFSWASRAVARGGDRCFQQR